MNSHATELNLKILHRVRDSIPDATLTSDFRTSLAHRAKFNAFLLRMARYHRHWTVSAQSELFHHIILENEGKLRSLLNLLRDVENSVIRKYAEKSSSIAVGDDFTEGYEQLKEDLDELAGYCPNIVEVSCDALNTQLSDFGVLSPSPAENGD